MNKFLRRAMILGLLSLNAQAEEKVWYCEMTGFAETSMEGVKTYKLEKFKMKVTPTEVAFGAGGYFNNTKIRVTLWVSPTHWNASDGVSRIEFYMGEFHCASAYAWKTLSASARCDEF